MNLNAAQQSFTGDRVFQTWFSGSHVVDADDQPLVVYRGEHGPVGLLSKRVAAFTFSDARDASVYAENMNDAGDESPISPRLFSAFVAIRHPVCVQDDPFLEMESVIAAFGRPLARAVAVSFAEYIQQTDYWSAGTVIAESGLDLTNFTGYPQDVAAVAAFNPAILDTVYWQAYPVFDDPDLVAMFQAAGFDGAIHGPSGAGLAREYRPFDVHQIVSATALTLDELDWRIAAQWPSEAEDGPVPSIEEARQDVMDARMARDQLPGLDKQKIPPMEVLLPALRRVAHAQRRYAQAYQAHGLATPALPETSLPLSEPARVATGRLMVSDSAMPAQLYSASSATVAPPRGATPAMGWMSPEDVEESLARMGLKSLVDQRLIQVHRLGSDMPVPQAEIGNAGRLLGLADLSTGVIHLNASRLQHSVGIAATVLHESLHAHMPGLLGGKGWGKLMDRLTLMYDQARDGRYTSPAWQHALSKVDAVKDLDGLDRAGEIEEFGAYALSRHLDSQKPLLLERWASDTVGFVKAWVLKRFDTQLGNVTTAQLKHLATMALKATCHDPLVPGKSLQARRFVLREPLDAETELLASHQHQAPAPRGATPLHRAAHDHSHEAGEVALHERILHKSIPLIEQSWSVRVALSEIFHDPRLSAETRGQLNLYGPTLPGEALYQLLARDPQLQAEGGALAYLQDCGVYAFDGFDPADIAEANARAQAAAEERLS